MFRFFTVYGPWGRPDMALFLFTKAALEGRSIDVFNYGEMLRDFTYVDDIVEAELQVADKKIELLFNWVSHETRKPVFEINLELNDGSQIVFDQQIIRITKDDQLVEQITAADLKGTVPFYLRGIDFTKQMQDLIGPADNLSTMKEALTVNRIINDILNS